jgi:hypothetical protein
MSQKFQSAIAVIGIDIGKNSFHVAGHDARGAIALRQKWARDQVEARLGAIYIVSATRDVRFCGPQAASCTAANGFLIRSPRRRGRGASQGWSARVLWR